MSANDDDNARSDLPEPVDDTAEAEVVAHSDEETEERPGCILRFEQS
ncbi:hypothetical protein [Virgisporangium ochraceum]|nr:hypothetical protein [Virgisporangium ochraceum]